MDKQRATNQEFRARQDRLVAQQALTRRFRLSFPREFALLQGIRDGLLTIFKEEGRQAMWFGEYPSALAYWLTTVEYPSVRKALRDRTFAAVYPRLTGAERLADWQPTLEPACEFLRGQLDMINDLLGRFNYFNHVSLLSMVSLCGGSQLCEAYMKSLNAWDPFLVGDSEYWLFQVLGVGWDLELHCAINASAAPERLGSPSLHILDSRANPMPGVDGSGGDALYLRIDLSRAPAEMDHALQYLRTSLTERLLEVHQGGSVPDWTQFSKSNFATAQLLPLSDLKLLHDKQQMIARFRGFWCWDLVNSEADAMSAKSASNKVSEAVADEDGIPGPVAVLDQYKLVSELISPESDEDSKLDMFYTRRHHVRLGLRTRAA